MAGTPSPTRETRVLPGTDRWEGAVRLRSRSLLRSQIGARPRRRQGRIRCNRAASNARTRPVFAGVAQTRKFIRRNFYAYEIENALDLRAGERQSSSKFTERNRSGKLLPSSTARWLARTQYFRDAAGMLGFRFRAFHSKQERPVVKLDLVNAESQVQPVSNHVDVFQLRKMPEQTRKINVRVGLLPTPATIIPGSGVFAARMHVTRSLERPDATHRFVRT